MNEKAGFTARPNLAPADGCCLYSRCLQSPKSSQNNAEHNKQTWMMHDADDCGIAKLYVCLYSPPFACVCTQTLRPILSLYLFVYLFIYLFIWISTSKCRSLPWSWSLVSHRLPDLLLIRGAFEVKSLSLTHNKFVTHDRLTDTISPCHPLQSLTQQEGRSNGL